MTADARLVAPAVARNRDPLLAALRPRLPREGLVLEIASGTGEHLAALAALTPDLTFQPTDPDPDARASADAWARHLAAGNMRPALPLDAAAPESWPVAAADAILCVNMVHISPWAATLGLMRGAARLLPAGAPLFLYGPFRRGGAHTAPSNAAFDESLRARDPAWGVRDLEAVAAAAEGFHAPEVIPMPANNLTLVFRRAPPSA
jgi:SAM-dependent methyltransferase